MKDRYVFGISESGGSYLVRLVVPRFVARVVSTAEETEHSREWGCRYILRSGEMFCDFDWIDPKPGEELRQAILAEAEDAWMFFASVYRS
ncbi:hypothetical protein DPQ33_13920 [Oceanidesulfovibrio indonesiensis]|uniref:Uncharacterized protein n=1 Tax=Oceanidesulfovibrio indonesiensis TaxID=54767 RepID=A0A7M3MCN3_9BACT|nr:hypothetical protein [Oceanidesulfovibrio indonesiensis]TVM15797.1 hypothetical protein DPQ33_13920 [Oceanidesulfovibrio indonesiensis]